MRAAFMTTVKTEVGRFPEESLSLIVQCPSGNVLSPIRQPLFALQCGVAYATLQGWHLGSGYELHRHVCHPIDRVERQGVPGKGSYPYCR